MEFDHVVAQKFGGALAAERQVAKSDFGEFHARWCEADQRLGQLAVDRLGREAADKITHLVSLHYAHPFVRAPGIRTTIAGPFSCRSVGRRALRLLAGRLTGPSRMPAQLRSGAASGMKSLAAATCRGRFFERKEIRVAAIATGEFDSVARKSPDRVRKRQPRPISRRRSSGPHKARAPHIGGMVP